MGQIEQKDLDWIGRAPFSISGSATTTASPEAIFTVLAEHERWPQWFPFMKKIVVLGPLREGVGVRRITTITGGKLHELFIVWDPGKRLAFTCTEISPPITRALLDDCRVERTDAGTTRITYTTYLEPPPPLMPAMRLIKSFMDRQFDKGMRALAARAERR